MKADQKVEAAPAGGGSKKLIIIILAVVLVLGAAGGGAAWFFLHGKADAGEEEAPVKKGKNSKKVKAGPPEYVPVEPFTVNLQPGDSGADQYLQIAFTLEVGGLEEKENVKNNMAKVRSRMLLLLSSKRAMDINTPEGKVQLAKEIITQLKEPFEDRGSSQDIEDVLFTSFIIQ
ncbi:MULTISPECIES: flagellar basal body-associated protein FliL [unclassified Duganella]|uniref:flagellar basal body-associated protein FliL n=1 Tax=unclassified Duganella TaxID=2636909 RepID=UPI000E35389B|nr:MULTISPECIES: flagellar basal body-associated protein FliL [unclassified Duganella]RFP14815.1 flagellar basal body-associated protein FliL [Duganella sp. BJB475]RFP31165.1 flagellar basal body-associated protein FliL [Duganella sp. BJB476]